VITLFNQSGEARLLKHAVYGLHNSYLYFGLYANDFTPSGDSFVIGDFTEVSGAGYSRWSVNVAAWATKTGGDPTVFSAADIVYTFSGAPSTGSSVYGYLVFDSAGNLIGAERFSDGPYTVAQSGDKVTLKPKLRLKDEADITGTSLEFTNVGEIRILKAMVSDGNVDGDTTYEFIPFTNTVTITDASVIGDFTLVSDASFKATLTMNSVEPVAGSSYATLTYSAIDAVNTSFSGTCTGYIVKGQPSGDLIGAQNFSQAISITTAGQKIRFTPVFSLRTGAF